MILAGKILEHELVVFESEFRKALQSKVSLLDKIMHYIVKRKGKQMRPRFVLLCAKLGGEVNAKTYRAASLVELLHTATLVHDDVVDEALERRSFFSINALWKNKVAVLVGDYLLSKGLLLSLENKDYDVLEVLSTAVKEMSEGELLQQEKSRNLNLDEDVYYNIIKGKTASLLASACAAGACSTFSDEKDVNNLKLFGEYTGMAFQIKDDLFDYGDANVGKPTGNDIKEKKLTLPLIYTLNNCSSNDKAFIINTIKNHNRNKDKVAAVIQIVNQQGGILYAENRMQYFRQKAMDILLLYPSSPVRDALEEMINFTTNRNY
ncbi:MAG: polyprenyl synthetase family protein [Chitinophagaceae bacterium]